MPLFVAWRGRHGRARPRASRSSRASSTTRSSALDLVLRRGRDRAVQRGRRRVLGGGGRARRVARAPRRIANPWLTPRSGCAPRRSSPAGRSAVSRGVRSATRSTTSRRRAIVASVGGVPLVTFLVVALNAFARRSPRRSGERRRAPTCRAQARHRRDRRWSSSVATVTPRRSRRPSAAARRARPGQRPRPRADPGRADGRLPARAATSTLAHADHRSRRPRGLPRVEHEHLRRHRPADRPLPRVEPHRDRAASTTRGCSPTRPSTRRPTAHKLLNLDVLFDPTGAVQGTYTKRHLVPFGEYVPFRARARALRRSELEQVPRDFQPGNAPGLFTVAGDRIATLICFESAFGYQVRPLVHDGAQVIVRVDEQPLLPPVGELGPARRDRPDARGRDRAARSCRPRSRASPR